MRGWRRPVVGHLRGESTVEAKTASVDMQHAALMRECIKSDLIVYDTKKSGHMSCDEKSLWSDKRAGIWTVQCVEVQ